MLAKKQDFLEKKIHSEEDIIRKNVKTNKKLALSALKRKKRYEKQLQTNDGTLNTLEQVKNIPCQICYSWKGYKNIKKGQKVEKQQLAGKNWA